MERFFKGHKIIVDSSMENGESVFICSIKPISIHTYSDKIVHADYVDKVSKSFVEAVNAAKFKIRIGE